jgi:hypothetical protein
MSTETLLDSIEKMKEKYYQDNGGKNSFLFKKTQKLDCAKEISKNFDLTTLIKSTIYIIPNTNKIMFNYTIFKLYANSENYEVIIQNVLDNYDEVLKTFDNFEAHVLLEGFTISAAERYKEAIKLFCQRCMNSSTKYAKLTSAMHIYYTPSMIESISVLLRPFLDSNVSDRIVLHSKAESCELLDKLLTTS